MPVSDAQFSAFLASDLPRIVLCELAFGYELAGAPAEGTLYLANRPYATQPTDSPANRPYRDVIRGLPRVERGINPDTVDGIIEISVGSMRLDNTDGSLDFLLRLVIDGRLTRFYLGGVAWARSDFRLVLVAIVETISGSEDQKIDVMLRDQRLLLDKPIAGDVVNDERRKPIVFTGGAIPAMAIAPVEKSAATLDYYVLQNFANGAVQAVYDNGATLDSGPLWSADNTTLTANAGTDTLTRTTPHLLSADDVIKFTATGGIFAGLTVGTQYWVIASGLTANDFKLSLTKGGTAVDITGTTFSGLLSPARKRFYDNAAVDGTIKLSSVAAGRLTADVLGYSASQDRFSGVTAEVVRAVLIDYGGIDAASVDSASFLAILPPIVAQRASRAVLDRENLLDVLRDLAMVTQVFFGPDHQGIFRAGRLDLSGLATATATRTLTQSDVFGKPKVSNARVITGTVALLSNRNYLQLSYGEFVDSVDVATRRTRSAQYQDSKENTAPSGTSYASNWQSYHKTAVRAEIKGAFAMGGAELSSVADEIVGDLKPHIKTIETQTDLRAYEWLLGEVVSFSYPRYGLDAGQKCRLIKTATDLAAERVDITLLTQMPPDTTTASY